jgi:hypothetical protein
MRRWAAGDMSLRSLLDRRYTAAVVVVIVGILGHNQPLQQWHQAIYSQPEIRAIR